MKISTETIERKADEVRRKLGISAISAPDMSYVLEKLEELIPKFSVQSKLALDMGQDEAWMDDESHTLTVRESVLDEAKAGMGRSRFTLAHELGHYFLGHEGRRRRNPNKAVYAGSTERIQENEADQFASYFLVPTDLACNATNADEIAQRFQVSTKVAEIAYARVQSARRRTTGEKRRPPDSVINFLREAKNRGYSIRSDISEFE